MNLTPRQRAEVIVKHCRQWSDQELIDEITTAIHANQLRAVELDRARLAEAKSAFRAALIGLAKAKQEAQDNHVQTGHASAALNRVLLHVTGCSAGEFDTYQETAERISEQLKDDAEHLKQTSEAFVQTTNELTAALDDLAKANSALTSEQIAHGKTMRERDALAEIIRETQEQITTHPVLTHWSVKPGTPEHLRSQVATLANYYDSCLTTQNLIAKQRDELALALRSNCPKCNGVGEVFICASKEEQGVNECYCCAPARRHLAAHDRAVAARVLRELAPQINEYDGKALLHEANLYERGEK